jgi:hypothetical protein
MIGRPLQNHAPPVSQPKSTTSQQNPTDSDQIADIAQHPFGAKKSYSAFRSIESKFFFTRKWLRDMTQSKRPDDLLHTMA